MNAINAASLDANTQLNALRDDAVAAGRAHGNALGLVHQILEFRALTLEGGRIEVGNVVGDDFDVGLLGSHAGRGNIE